MFLPEDDVAVFKTVLVMSKGLPKCNEHVIVHLENLVFCPSIQSTASALFGPTAVGARPLEIEELRVIVCHSTYSFHLYYATVTLSRPPWLGENHWYLAPRF